MTPDLATLYALVDLDTDDQPPNASTPKTRPTVPRNSTASRTMKFGTETPWSQS